MTLRQPSLVRAVFPVCIGALWVAACGTSPASPTPGSWTPTEDASPPDAAVQPDGSLPPDPNDGLSFKNLCTPPCDANSVCNANGKCIPKGSCETTADCQGKEGYACDSSTKTCVLNPACGYTSVEAKRIEPNLLIVLDRSCSMKNAVGTTGSRWSVAVSSITKLTTAFEGRLRFGLTLFPEATDRGTGDPIACTQTNAIPVPVGDKKEAPIRDLLGASLVKDNSNYPDGPCITNIDAAMDQAAKDPVLTATDRPNYVLLLTDGAQAGCGKNGVNGHVGGDAGTVKLIQEMNARTPSVKTFVVGFSGDVDATQLNLCAKAGGVPASTDPGTDSFYKADSLASLDAALQTIGRRSMSCDLPLAKPPSAPDKVNVLVDGRLVTPDPSQQDRWSYDSAATAVRFYGPTCEKLKDGTLGKVEIFFACPDGAPR